MKFKFLAICSFAFTCLALHAATIGTSIGGSSDAVLFETSGGDPLSGGRLFVGAYEGASSIGLGLGDVEANFRMFGSGSSLSGPFGNFASESFDGNVIPSGDGYDFRGQQIYALVINSSSIASATEFAFFTADSLANWIFPSVDDAGINPGSDETDIIYNQQNNLLAGVNSSLDPDGDGAAGTFDSIRLVAVPEPSSAMLLVVSSLALLRRGGRK